MANAGLKITEKRQASYRRLSADAVEVIEAAEEQ
jgi:hypothetical protein